MKVVTPAGETILGTTEAAPTIGIVDYSRRVTDDFGVTTVVERGFARRMSVRLAVPFESVDAVQRRLADLRATPATWIADDRFASLSVRGIYKDFEIDHAVPPLSYCTLTVEGLVDVDPLVDAGGDPAPADQISTLQLLQPAIVTNGVLIASNIAETDYPEWSTSVAYPLGARVIKAATHRIYESAAKGNTGNDPAGGAGPWVDIGPTNRWAMFDQALGSAASAASPIVVTLDAGAISAVALLDVVGATVRVQVAGYDRTQAVGAGAITFVDLPADAGRVTVTIAGPGQVSCGTLLIGRLVRLGITESAPTAGITDFSRKEVDDFGTVTIVERAFAKRMTARALIRTDAIDVVGNRIAAVRARPSLWIGQAGMDSLTVYGFFKDFSIEVGETLSKLSLQIEGLSKAAPIEPLKVGIDWPDVGDPDGTKPKPGADKTSENTAKDTAAVGGRPANDVTSAIDKAKGDIDALVATFGTTQSAAQSADAARDAEANAKIARDGAQGARDAAQEARTLAAGSATSAATSKDAAAQSKTDAQTAATASAGARDAAGAARDLALGYRDAAGTARDAAIGARDAAGGARDTAVQKAGEASTSASNAGGSATTASGQATIATQKADAAGQSASTATAQADIARTKAGEAGVFRDQAATSEASALGSKTAAATSQMVAASSAAAVNLQRAMLLPDRPDNSGADYFYGGSDTANIMVAPSALVTTPANATAANYGPVYEAVLPAANTLYFLYPRGVVPTAPGRIYRIEVEFQQTTVSGSSATAVGRLSFQAMSGSFGSIANAGRIDAPFTGAVQTASLLVSDTADAARGILAWPANTAWIRPWFRPLATGLASMTAQIRRLTVTDVTQAMASAASAGASASSASSASTSKTGAEQAASASQNSATQANTARGDAQTSATQASSSKDSAAGSASTATSQAGVATQAKTDAIAAKDQAASSASAASGSAQTATTRADAAGQSASAAQAGAATATTKAGEASASQQQAALSESNAAGSKNAAALSAAVSATARDTTLKSGGDETFESGVLGYENIPGIYVGEPNIATAVAVAADHGRANVIRTSPGLRLGIISKKRYPITSANQKWEIAASARLVSGSSGSDFYIGYLMFDASGTRINGMGFGNYPLFNAYSFANNEWVNPTAIIGKTDTTGAAALPAAAASFAVALFVNDGFQSSSAVYSIDYITVREITADLAATASAQSSQTASASRQGAELAATAANQSRVDAQTAEGRASVSAGAAAGSASSAAGSSNSAATSQTVAASSAKDAKDAKDAAAGSASASAGSAQIASTKADEAGQSASSASASLNAAQTARGGAEAARDQAAQSRTDAAGSASSASSSANLAAGSATIAGEKASAANTSERNAASSATSAGQQASAAEASKTAAQTARGQAETLAGQASSSKDDAAGSASTASSQAGLAAQAKSDAVNAASASNVNAGIASTKAGEAGNSALAANQSKLDAQAANGSAAGSASAAAGSAAAADRSASSATSSATLASNFSQGAITKNPHFAQPGWGGLVGSNDNPPPAWSPWLNNNAGYVGKSAYGSFYQPGPALQIDRQGPNAGIAQHNLGVAKGWHVAEFDVYVEDGDWSGVGAHLNGGNGFTFSWRFAEEKDTSDVVSGPMFGGNAPNGTRRQFAILFYNGAQANSSASFYLMASWTDFPTYHGNGVGFARTVWHKALIRPASQGEIDGRKARIDASTNSARIEEVRSTLANDLGALASRTTSVEAKANGVEARTGIVETAVANAAGKQAAARLELSAGSPGGRASITVRSDSNNGAGVDIVGDVKFKGQLDVQSDTGGNVVTINSRGFTLRAPNGVMVIELVVD